MIQADSGVTRGTGESLYLESLVGEKEIEVIARRGYWKCLESGSPNVLTYSLYIGGLFEKR